MKFTRQQELQLKGRGLPPSFQRQRARRRSQPRKRSRGSTYISIMSMIEGSYCTYQVVTEELHNEGGVLVALLAQGVEFYTSKVSMLLL
jgi:hypothetical protein